RPLFLSQRCVQVKVSLSLSLSLSLSESPAGLMWSEQFSPHLQRNKQLQDALLQREEELLRLQDENQQLRGFLSSAFVRNLQREAKRHLTYGDDGSFQNRGHQLQTSQVSKRVCRNLTTEFCSSSSSSEPNLDLWVLRTLGLKDRDTIDTSSESSCSSAPSRVQSLEGNPARPPAHWSPLRGTRTPSRDTIQFSPPFSPISSPSPTPAPPRRRTDLAFRMSLSPSSSVKTHSFPQGQAFVRKDPEGRCNFTWVPTQRP
uniref:Geminin coiled-coil domain containing n=1 Tax=Cyclopterus lumpus TaxID=8103 RepID=A0A8C2WZL2_CYCLU